MTSDATSLFVWIHLPGQAEPVVCGRFTHRRAGGREVGEFVYGRSYLARAEAVPLDPVVLPLQERVFLTSHLGGWFSALLDSGPDDWGRRLIEQMHGSQDTIGYLLHARGQNVGALAFSPAPDAPPPAAPATLGVEALERLLDVHRTVEQGEAVASEFRDLLLQGTSAGGARPKTTVEHEGRLWLAKFPSSRDRPEEPPVPLMEAALLTLAGRCDIRVPPHRVLDVAGAPVLLVERFDREPLPGGGQARWRYASARTLLWSRPEVQQYSFMGSYTNLARQMRVWERAPLKSIRELYRRIAFNCLVGNTDDHDRNTGFVAGPDGFFRLAPAFDLTTRPRTPRMYLALAFGSQGAEVSLANLLSEPGSFGYERDEAQEMILAQWRTIRASFVDELVGLGCPLRLAARAFEALPEVVPHGR